MLLINLTIKQFFVICLLLLLVFLISSCAGLSEGITRAIISNNAEGETDNRQCKVIGSSFRGIEGLFEDQRTKAGPKKNNRSTVKILMVHGIGPHEPGYGTRFLEMLAKKLKFNVRNEKYKEISLSQSKLLPKQTLGTLRLIRYSNKDESREILFYELTWSAIFDKYRKDIAYDNSGEHSYQRADLNKQLKQFTNSHIADPVIYLGKAQEQVNISFNQAFCWAASSNFNDFPSNGVHSCDPKKDRFLKDLDDDIVFVSHSLGSRLVLNALNKLAELLNTGNLISKNLEAGEPPPTAIDVKRAERKVNKLRNNKYLFYMLSNQLPLLQLGQPLPKVTNQIARYCLSSAPEFKKRFAKNVNIVAFNDPNDLLSYGIPPKFVDNYIDSRLCPSLINITINIAQVVAIPVLGEIANPMTAHTEYDHDERVISLITGGIGNKNTDSLIKERCEWLETR